MKTEAAAPGRTTPAAGSAPAPDDLADELRRRLFTARLASWLVDVALNAPTGEEDINDDAA